MKRGLIVTAVVTAVCIMAVHYGCDQSDNNLKRSSIPAKFGAGNVLAKGDCGDLLSSQGAYVLPISTATAKAIRSQGIAYFQDTDEDGNRAKRPYFNGVWKPTPFPDDGSDRTLSNLTCALEQSTGWPPKLVENVQKAGGFYQAEGGRALIVLPRRGYVVAITSDR